MKLWSFLRQMDKLADRYVVVVIIALAGLLLRVPSFFEPVWYGDEAIYLTIGHALNQGRVLYKDIVDHKTPLIYYIATVDDQTWLRLLTGIGMVVATISFFFVCRFWFKSKTLAYLATTAFMLLTTLPWLEGPMANGELWVLIFVMPSLWIMTRIESVRAYFLHTHHFFSVKDRKDNWQLMLAGVLLGLALMTKVPAMFDLTAIYLLLFLPHLASIVESIRDQEWSLLIKKLKPLMTQYLYLSLGIGQPFLFFVLYFASHQALAEYLNYGLLYNLHYAGTWRPEFGSALMAGWFSLPGKGLTLLLIIMGSLFLAIKQHRSVAFFMAWFGLDLFAVLLSNRPYPHYLLQLMPAFILLVLAVWHSRKNLRVMVSFGLVIFWLMVSLKVINFYFYPVRPYFTRFADRLTGRISREEYNNSFNSTVRDNTAITAYLQQYQVDTLYIWGSNPLLYAQGKFLPTTKLITLFHIDDLQAHPATLAQLQSNPPPFIIVMKKDPITYAPFASWLNTYYIPNHQFEQASLWRKVSDPMILSSTSLIRGK